MRARWWVVGYAIAVGVALLSPLASGEPDGLERVATDHGYIDQAEDPSYSIIPDYAMPGIENEAVATIVAGIVGVTIMFGLLYGLSWLMVRSSARRRRTG
jgi:hypothetical protein